MFRVKLAMCSPMASIEAKSAAFARNDKLASSLRSSCCSSATFSAPRIGAFERTYHSIC